METWFLCQVDTEIAVFDISYFEDLWKDLFINEGKLIEKNVLASSSELFRSVNDLTLTMLVYELFELKTFKKGQLVMEQSKKAPTN